MIDPVAVTKVNETIRLYPVVTNKTKHLFSDKASPNELVVDGKLITTAPIKSNHPQGFDLIALCQQGADVILDPRITVSSIVLELEHDVLHFDVTGMPGLAYIGGVAGDQPQIQLNTPSLILSIDDALLVPSSKDKIDLQDVFLHELNLTIQLRIFSTINLETGACVFHSSVDGIFYLRDNDGVAYSESDPVYLELSEKIKKAKVSFELSAYAIKSTLNVAY